MISKKLQQLATMAQGTLILSDNNEVATGITIDTRSMTSEEVFIPIIGENFDGHEYVQSAFDKGAKVSLFQVDHDYVDYNKPLILVDDTRIALGHLAQAYLSEKTTKVIGITGSNGKTSTKDILSGLLEPYFEVTKTQGNHNNDIGLPLTILGSDPLSNLYILEMGMDKLGEIDYLSHLTSPDIALITSIGSAHLNDLGSIEKIIEAKLEITHHLKPGGTLIVNGDHDLLMETLESYELNCEVITYGLKTRNDYVISDVNQFRDTVVFRCEKLTDKLIEVPLLGKHQAMNALGALLAARKLNLPMDTLLENLKHVSITKRRNEVVRVGQSILIDDSYKSNPEALKESLILLSDYPVDARKIAVLGDMLDLGKDEVLFHQDLSRLIEELNIDRVYTIGNLAKHFHDFHTKIHGHFNTQEDLIDALKVWLNQPSVMLFKGANALKLFDVVEALKTTQERKDTPMQKVAVIFGGKSSEYLVSLSSTASVLQHFPEDKYELILIGMSKEGLFYQGDYLIEEIENDTWMDNPTSRQVMIKTGNESVFFYLDDNSLLPVDVAFNMIHGKVGEDGVLQALLKVGNIQFTGCDQESSILCYDKDITHRLLDNEGINKAKYRTLTQAITQEEYLDLVDYLGQKVLLKPAREGSSYGISIAHNYEEFAQSLVEALKFDTKVVVEEFIEGFEVGASILEKDGTLIVGEVDEIELHTDFFDYDAKYSFKDARIVLPARIDDKTKNIVKENAKLVFELLECQDFARIDFFYGKNGQVYFNEINTIPGFTSHSRYPNMMKGIGIEYREIISTLIENALKRI